MTSSSSSSKKGRSRQQLPARSESDNNLTASTSNASSGDGADGATRGVLIDNYEVFLSFRGEDTRTGFTSHLYEALHDHGVRTFLDNVELERGQSLKPQLDQAINKSEIVIAVISKSHATSKWCLDELLAIVQCGKPVIPIFYHVDPSDFRNQTGPFAEAFRKHERQFGAGKVKEWRDAMTIIANHSGYDLEKTADGIEAKVVKMIIRDVLKRVNKGKANVGKDLPGMDSRMKNVLRKLNMGVVEDVKMFGICGTGGLGKTTLAQTIYNELLDEFEFKCFIENVRAEASREDGLVSLQKYLISEISRDKCDEKLNSSQAIEKVQRSLRNKCVLIVLDDVDDEEQLDALAGELDWFGAGSRIIITTRNKGLLVSRDMIRKDLIFEASALNHDESRTLFCRHAFKKDAPGIGYEELANGIISKLGGHPLALKVTGANLFGKRGKEIWSQMSKKLEEGSLDQKVQKCLSISIDGLDEDEKEIYLDICGFFIGKDVDEALYMWEAGGFQYSRLAIEELESKSLLQIDEENKFQMHDVVRDMGRHIISSRSKETRSCSSRIWNKEDALILLENSKGTSEVQGLLANFDRRKKVSLDTTSFAALSNLRLLSCGGAEIDGSFESFPSKLNSLDWSHCELENLPDEMELRECAVLRLSHSNFIQLSMEPKVFPKLVVLDLQRCEKLKTLPLDLSTTIPNLKRLLLRDCSNLVGLPDSLCSLIKLEVLDMYGCGSVDRLPEDFGGLKSLKVFILDATRVLDLPSSMIELSELILFHWCPAEEHIDLIRSKGEEELERLINIITVGTMKKLSNLKLPPIQHFVLKVLYKYGSNTQLISQLTHLEFVRALLDESTPNYSQILVKEGEGKKAAYNNIENVVASPVGHGAHVAPVLELLRIEMPKDGPLSELDTLPSMPSLVDLDIQYWVSCKYLWSKQVYDEIMEEEVDDQVGTSTAITSPAPCLKTLALNSLSNIETLPCLPSLEELNIGWCGCISSLWEQDDAAPEKLKVLEVYGCPSLSWNTKYLTTQLPKLQNLTADYSLRTYLLDVQPVLLNLESLEICDCRLIGDQGGEHDEGYNFVVGIINWLKKLPRLSRLIITNTSITSIRGPWHELPQLETLEIRNAKSLKNYSLVEADNCNPPPPKLRELIIFENWEPYSMSITKLPEDLIHLKRLRIQNLRELRILPEMPNLPELEELVIEYCYELESLPRSWVEGLLGLHNLTRITLADCPYLRVTLPQKLYEKGLEVYGCEGVEILDVPHDTIVNTEEDEVNNNGYSEEDHDEEQDQGEE